jgi:hypothetical protein
MHSHGSAERSEDYPWKVDCKLYRGAVGPQGAKSARCNRGMVVWGSPYDWPTAPR